MLGDRQELTTDGKLSLYCTWEFVSHIKETQIIGSNAICNQDIYNTNDVNTLNYVSSLGHSPEPQLFIFFSPNLI